MGYWDSLVFLKKSHTSMPKTWFGEDSDFHHNDRIISSPLK